MDNPHKPSPPEEKAVKRWMPLALTLCAGAVFAQTQKPATPAEDMNAFAAVQTAHSCEEADKIKFSKDAYLALDPTERVFLDATWQSCQTPKDSEEQPTIIVNPTPTGDNDRVFYGLVKRKQLREAQKTCATAGLWRRHHAVVGTVTGVPGTSEIGTAMFQYADVSCSSLAAEIEKGNVLAALGPSMLVQHAVLNKMSKDLVRNIPLVSGADKAKIFGLIDKATAMPMVTIGRKNVEVELVGVKASVKKPKVIIKKPKIVIKKPKITL
ncbi:hypothetical protein [Cupriavidus necator]|uniref:hypothetical protein n=1 Tax=Cupriavidus necator TaxID=106590 RepID=UPI001E553A37|nr:hypothetical protein [Cupriavidus necator]